jgi:YggT family protein
MIVVELIRWFLNLYMLIVLARVLLSWFPTADPYHPVVRFLYDVTEPVLQPIRQFLRQQFPDMGPFDFSPLILMVGIMIFERILVASLA